MIDGGPMPDPRQLTDEEATQRRRRWLQERHARTRELVVVLLRQAPEAEVVRALDQLPGGELQRLARLLTVASLTGIVNLLGGEGIAFDQLDAPAVARHLESHELASNVTYPGLAGSRYRGAVDKYLRGGGAADPRACAGHQHDLVCNPVHALLP